MSVNGIVINECLYRIIFISVGEASEFGGGATPKSQHFGGGRAKKTQILANIIRVPLGKFLAFGLGGRSGPKPQYGSPPPSPVCYGTKEDSLQSNKLTRVPFLGR